MQIILHQIKKEWMSQRWALGIWYALLGMEVLMIGSDFLGGFKNPSRGGIGDGLSEIIKVLVAIGVVMIPAALALNDPPTEETAHWQVLPVRPLLLLVSKLLVIVVFMLVPLCLMHLVAWWLGDVLMWTGIGLADLLGSYPSWMLLGLAFGAASGSWRTFSIVMILFWSGLMLAMLLVEGISSSNGLFMYWVYSSNLEAAIHNSFHNSVFLFGSVVLIVLRFFFRIPGKWLSAVFLVCFLMTVNLLPILVSGFVPPYQTEAMIQDKKITIEFEPPTTLLSYTNQNNIRVTGPSPYSKLTMDGLGKNYFLMPARLDATLQVYEEADPTVRRYFSSRTSMVPSYFEHMPFENHILESMFAWRKMQQGMDVINPIESNEMDFEVFDVDSTVLKLRGNSVVDLDMHWWVKPYRFEHIGDLLLEVGSEFSNNGTTVRLAAWLPDGEDRTQIKLHVRTFVLPKQSREVDPRWEVSCLRFLLINEQANQVCISTSSSYSTLSDLCHVGYHSIIRDFSLTDDSNDQRPVPDDWLENAKLRVFRVFPGAQTKVNHFMEEVNIVDLPITPRVQPTDGRN